MMWDDSKVNLFLLPHVKYNGIKLTLNQMTEEIIKNSKRDDIKKENLKIEDLLSLLSEDTLQLINKELVQKTNDLKREVESINRINSIIRSLDMEINYLNKLLK